MTDSNAKQAAQSVLKKMKKKSSRRPRTLNLDDEMFVEFQQYCLGTGHSVSDIVENLMREYLNKLKESSIKEAG